MPMFRFLTYFRITTWKIVLVFPAITKRTISKKARQSIPLKNPRTFFRCSIKTKLKELGRFLSKRFLPIGKRQTPINFFFSRGGEGLS